MDLYFKNVGLDNSWNNVLNWFTDLACTVQAANVPWTAGDTTYLGYDLHSGTEHLVAADYVNIDADIIADVTGTCDIGIDGLCYLYNYAPIYGGTFSGASFYNYAPIYGGTFTGDYFTNYDNAAIYGGTFTGDYFTNSSYIYGGTFGGDYLSNGGYIYGGTFSGANFYNHNIIQGGMFTGYYSTNGNAIYGGTFTGDYFTNYNNRIYGGTFTGAYFTNYDYGQIYGGTFTGANFTNDFSYIYGGFWLESGSMDVPVTTYNAEFGTTDITGFLRITGGVVNPFPYDMVGANYAQTTETGIAGFITINIPGQDVLGTGLL